MKITAVQIEQMKKSEQRAEALRSSAALQAKLIIGDGNKFLVADSVLAHFRWYARELQILRDELSELHGELRRQLPR